MRRGLAQLYIISCTTKPLCSLPNNSIHTAASYINTKVIFQQGTEKVCFAQLIPRIQLETNQVSTLFKGNIVWS